MRKYRVLSFVVVLLFGAVAVAGESKQDQKNRKVVDFLLNQVQTADSEGRLETYRRLANIPSDERVIPALVEAATTTNRPGPTVEPIMLGIGSMGEEARQAIPLLCETLTNRSVEIRWRTAFVLRQAPKATTVCVPVLESLISEKDDSVRYYAAMALIRNGTSEKGVSALRDMLMHCHYVDRWCSTAGEDFVTLGPSAKSCVGLMLELLRDRVNLVSGGWAENYIKGMDNAMATMAPGEIAMVDTQLVAAAGQRLRGWRNELGRGNTERVQLFESCVEQWFRPGGREMRLKERAAPRVARGGKCRHDEMEVLAALSQLDKVAARLKAQTSQGVGEADRAVSGIANEIGNAVHVLLCARSPSGRDATPALKVLLSCDDEVAAEMVALALAAVDRADEEVTLRVIRLASGNAIGKRMGFESQDMLRNRPELFVNAVPGLLNALSLPYSGERDSSARDLLSARAEWKPRYIALRTLAGIGPQVIPAVQTVWGDLTEPNRRLLLDMVLEMGPDAVKKMEPQFALRVKQLLADTTSPDRTLRWLAVHDMRRIGLFPEMATPALVQAAKDPDWIVRAESALALAMFGKAGELVAELARDPDARVARVAAMAQELRSNKSVGPLGNKKQ